MNILRPFSIVLVAVGIAACSGEGTQDVAPDAPTKSTGSVSQASTGTDPWGGSCVFQAATGSKNCAPGVPVNGTTCVQYGSDTCPLQFDHVLTDWTTGAGNSFMSGCHGAQYCAQCSGIGQKDAMFHKEMQYRVKNQSLGGGSLQCTEWRVATPHQDSACSSGVCGQPLFSQGTACAHVCAGRSIGGGAFR